MTTKKGEMIVHIIGVVTRIHDAPQLLITNDKHLEIFPAEKMSILTKVVESSHTRR